MYVCMYAHAFKIVSPQKEIRPHSIYLTLQETTCEIIFFIIIDNGYSVLWRNLVMNVFTRFTLNANQWLLSHFGKWPQIDLCGISKLLKLMWLKCGECVHWKQIGLPLTSPGLPWCTVLPQGMGKYFLCQPALSLSLWIVCLYILLIKAVFSAERYISWSFANALFFVIEYHLRINSNI